MSEEYGRQNSITLGNDLLKAISICEERIRVSRQNEERFHSIAKQKASAEKLLEMTRATANHMNNMYKNVKYFLENKKETSKQVLEASIRSVSAVVKDADLVSCTINHKNNKTTILNQRNQNINKREGSAARATMGFILRYVCLKALPNKIQIMFLDEALATLSTTTSVNIRELLEEFAKDIGIVGIEQKDVLYNGITSKKYVAIKTNNVSVIKEVME